MEHRPFSPATLASAAPDIALGLVYLGAWIKPAALAPGFFATLTLIMLLEFIIIHSAAFMGSILLGTAERRAKLTAMLGLGGFYTLFVGGFSIAFHTAWPLVSFWALMANRLSGVLLKQAPEGEERLFVQRSWAVSTLFYLLGAFVSVVPPLPHLGLTPDVVPALHVPGSGLWISQPHRLAAFGFLYFTAVGISELYGHAWLKMQTAAATQAPATR
jgi:hypothetical protein